MKPSYQPVYEVGDIAVLKMRDLGLGTDLLRYNGQPCGIAKVWDGENAYDIKLLDGEIHKVHGSHLSSRHIKRHKGGIEIEHSRINRINKKI